MTLQYMKNLFLVHEKKQMRNKTLSGKITTHCSGPLQLLQKFIPSLLEETSP